MPHPQIAERVADGLVVSPAEVERRLAFVGFGSGDRDHLLGLAEVLGNEAVRVSDAFFDYLSRFPEAEGLIQNAELLQRAKTLKVAHLRAMLRGPYGAEYAEERLALGRVYALAGIGTNLFLGAFQHLLEALARPLMAHYSARPEEGISRFMSLKKLAFFDIGLIVDAIVFERERVIRFQEEAIRELSTPVLRVKEGLLVLPLVGMVDTRRARQITEALLAAIGRSRARVVVLDITGVPMVDSKVAAHLIQTMTSARLMGALPLLTGMSSAVAQSLGALSVELDGVLTFGDLQRGLEEAERLIARRRGAGAALDVAPR